MNSLFISPHNDDETLFGAFTLIREKPMVLMVTKSYIQAQRGDGITAGMRIEETIEALKILGCPVFFSGIPDTLLTKEELHHLLWSFEGFDRVYAPKPYEGGNPHHNMIGEVAGTVYDSDKLSYYSTYTKDNLYMTGDIEIVPTQEELELKAKALQCYRSQLSLPSTRPHFQAVLGKSEWIYK